MSTQKSIKTDEIKPRISCLMVTGNRKRIARRAVKCFMDQTYPNKELVVLDDGSEDYSDIFNEVPKGDIHYHRIQKQEGTYLGGLRNMLLDRATGDYLAQWDDDDWYHPDRLAIQAEYLQNGNDACWLSSTLMHIDTQEHTRLPFIGGLPDGVPGTIMHVNSRSIRYPNIVKGEDTVYQKEWMKLNWKKLPETYSHLFIRCFHGTNTWGENHFYRRSRNSVKDFIVYLWYKYIIRDMAKNPKFRLNKDSAQAMKLYLEDSRSLDLLKF
jgi:glycosyltransferase involved in cell wall biosynthesis